MKKKPQEQVKSDIDKIKVIALAIKNHFENKDWKRLKEMLKIPSIWFFDRPVSVDEFIKDVEKSMGSAQDVEMSLLALKKTEIIKTEAKFSFSVQVIWSDGKTWEEHEKTFDMALGLIKIKKNWQVDYMGLLPCEGVSSAMPVGLGTIPAHAPYFDSIQDIYTQGSATAAYFNSTPQLQTIAQAAAPYFMSMAKPTGYGIPQSPCFMTSGAHGLHPAMPDLDASPLSEASKTEAAKTTEGHVSVYVPIFIPEKLVASLIKK